MAIEVILPHSLAARATRRTPGQWLLTVAVLGWFALMILVPAAALVSRALRGGIGPFLSALVTSEAIRAFALTLRITAIATVFNTLFGVAFALVLVRHRFWGHWLA